MHLPVPPVFSAFLPQAAIKRPSPRAKTTPGNRSLIAFHHAYGMENQPVSHIS